MTDSLPDYTAVEPPEGKAPAEYTTHERRAAVLRRVIDVGSPAMVNQADLADRYDVHPSTISRDMDRLRESIDDHLGDDSKMTTWALRQRVVEELLDEDDWRATKAAWDVDSDWRDWLGEIGEQHREPDRQQVELEATTQEVQYTVVAGDGQPLLGSSESGEDDVESGETGTEEPEDLGFTSTPTTVEVEAPGGDGGD